MSDLPEEELCIVCDDCFKSIMEWKKIMEKAVNNG